MYIHRFAEDYGRLVEIYDFPAGMITRDLLILFREYRWVLELFYLELYTVISFNVVMDADFTITECCL